MKNWYDQATYDSILERIHKLDETSQANWGKMDVAQMLDHCAEVNEVMNGNALKNTPIFLKLIAPFIRRSVVSPKAYTQNLPTHPQYRQADAKVFASSKARLLASLETFISEAPEAAAQRKHPLFGKMSIEERGWASYKHLTHHLEQFSV